MATRSGSVDPGALVYFLRERGLSVDELDAALEHESGLAALGGLDDPLAFAIYTYRIAGAVAHMAMALGGIDVLAFSGGVGENRGDVRAAIADRLAHVGDFAVEVVTGAGGPGHRSLGARAARLGRLPAQGRCAEREGEPASPPGRSPRRAPDERR